MSAVRNAYEPVAQINTKKLHKVLVIIHLTASLIAVVFSVSAFIVAMVSMSNNKEYKEDVNIEQMKNEIQLTSSEIKKLIDRVEKERVNKQKNVSVPSGKSLSVLPNAHIGFKLSEGKSGRPEFNNHHPEKLRLDEQSAGSYHNGLHVSVGGIKILSTGLYYVYSSITYKLTDVSCLDLTFQTWFHYVQKTSTGEYPTNGVLLRTVHTCSDQQLSGSGESKFIGGVFYLEEGDIISALCSGLNLVMGGNDRSFIGLFMLSEG
ncbi:uncharacterized protein LOC106062944 isoform X2 [Biomphalaria glabrata]|uniref:Uncharacterized protein LOC106062944 isoform X2 n=1 Tax=Biomphalaria glabrata TaxID=6526 RepID=A0A9W2ZDD4_BIOGL|nr:uncharacterized protein LOC106062944 isoform X2 [Biomphalaria glabrata]